MTHPLLNLHNHTPFSDGAYTIDELCEAHLGLRGVRVDGIGVCDHLFCTPSSHPVSDEREFLSVFERETRRYIDDVHAARQRWAGRLAVYCGCEINWPLNRGMLPAIQRLMHGIDYVLFEFLDWAALTQLASQARRWPCPVGLAHTDVRTAFANTSLDQVVRTLANARIFYEINTKLMPLEQHAAWFDILPRHRVLVSLGTDTHDDLGVLDTLTTLRDFAQRRELGDKLFVPHPRAEAAA
ncbi:MAG TPA: hypothetical protein PKC49_10770 [Phycisphaerae bacterium]|nr:hypothetical protein [Phycisphaerae bacterium]